MRLIDTDKFEVVVKRAGEKRTGEPSKAYIEGFIDGLESVLEDIDMTPTVEFFHAHWVKEIDRHYHWHCSVCKHVVGVQRMECNFCPNCGAKMDGPETEEVSGDGEKVE